MTLRLTPVYTLLGAWMGRWRITGDGGAPIGEVYQVAGEKRCIAVAADVELAGPTLARTMTALTAVLEHAAGYIVVDDPSAADVPCSRVIRADEQAPIRVDEHTSTPVMGVPMRPTVALHLDRAPVPAT